MSVAVGVLTHNAIRYGRLDLLKQTLRSLAAQEPDRLYIVSNGSDDGTEDYVASLGGTVINDPVTSCGHGMNVTIDIAVKARCDHVVFSNDDIGLRPGSLAAITAFLEGPPDDIVLASALLEDDYPWNTVLERVDTGGRSRSSARPRRGERGRCGRRTGRRFVPSPSPPATTTSRRLRWRTDIED